MQVGGRARPVPNADDDIALDSLRPRRFRRRKFAGRNTVGPIGEQFEGALTIEPADVGRHLRHGLSRLNSTLPGFRRTLEIAKRGRDGPRRLVAELVTRITTVGLDHVEPLTLAGDFS